MRVKRYRAPDMHRAFEDIRAEMGAEAVILESRKVRAKGLGGFFRKRQLEVLAGVDTDLADFPRQKGAPTKPAVDWGTALLRALREPRLDQIQERLAAIEGQMKKLSPAGAPATPLEDELRARGLGPELIQELAEAARAQCNPGSSPAPEELLAYARRHLQGMLATSGPLEVAPGRGKALFLVGPTGVGKTTTLAKMAANLAQKEPERLLLVSFDTFRTGALAQMESYARILRLPFRVAYDPQELALLQEEAAPGDTLLIDSPGCSPRNGERLHLLGQFIKALPQAEVHLALNPGLSYQDLRLSWEGFSQLPIQKLMLTKVDEAASLAGIMDLVCQVKLPISYLTTGQKIPQDIEPATPERIVELAFQGGPNLART